MIFERSLSSKISVAFFCMLAAGVTLGSKAAKAHFIVFFHSGNDHV